MLPTDPDDVELEKDSEHTDSAVLETATPEGAQSETRPQHIRGPLRYQVGVSLAQLEAGTAFTLSLQITNPYDVPVTILDVNLPVPVEFVFDTDGTTKLNTRIGTGTGIGKENILQPGNSNLRLFALRSTRAIFFTPASYNLYIQLAYQMDGQVHHDAVNYQLNIRAPLKALIIGSIFGSIIGYLLRDIFDRQGLEKLLTQSVSAATLVPWLVGLFGNALLGVVLVIAFARKKDTQPILSVEDFWGGLFVGFLAGYTGKSILSQVLTPSTPGAG